MTADTPPELYLERPRDLGDLLADTFTTWFRHLALFLVLALVVVLPVTALLEGWRAAVSDLNATSVEDIAWAPLLLGSLSNVLIVTPLVTAMHVFAVMELAAGRKPSIGHSARSALSVFPRLLVVVLLYAVAVALGFVLLILPGIFLAILFVFVTQAVVVERAGVGDAFRTSRRMVSGSWWRTFGIVLLVTIIAGIVGAILGQLLGGIAGALTDSEPLLILASIVQNTISLSLSALALTLLFFDLRARHQGPPAAAAPPAPAGPEHPGWG